MFEHVILTRFNLATPGREEEIRNRPGWLSRRFELFEKYCLPAIAAQSCKDFTWIIYFDKDTPQEFKGRIETLRESCPFVPYYTGLFPSDGWRRSVQEVLGDKNPQWLISTRLDNDDALATDYVARIQAAAKAGGMQKTAFNITHGCVISGDRIYDMEHRSNAFFSLLEPYNDEMGTAPSIAHMTLAEHAPVVQVPGGPGWLQVVHGENVSNKIRGVRVHPDQMRGLFLDEALADVPVPARHEILLENTLVTPLRSLRDWLAARRHQPSQ